MLSASASNVPDLDRERERAAAAEIAASGERAPGCRVRGYASLGHRPGAELRGKALGKVGIGE